MDTLEKDSPIVRGLIVRESSAGSQVVYVAV